MTDVERSNVIGSLIFCPECGNILDMPGGDETFYFVTNVVMPTLFLIFQSPLKAKRHLVQQSQQKEAEATCPQCGNDEMAYHTMQLRSADEGQTIFYNCKKCGYKYSVNS
ncbi:unnamed protein product [Cunninghamella echinulata]